MDIQNYQSKNDEDLSSYEVRYRREIERILRGMLDERALIYARAAGSTASSLTLLIDLDEGDGVAYLERVRESQVDEDITAAKGVDLEGRHEGVSIRFHAAEAVCVDHDGVSAYRIRIPKVIYRMQRRECFRSALPVLFPAKCVFPLNGREIDAKITDISVGGVGLQFDPLDGAEPAIETGQSIEGCRLYLPECDEITLALRVRNIRTVTLRNDMQVQRAGCQFLRVPSAVERVIQLFIFKVEKKRREQL